MTTPSTPSTPSTSGSTPSTAGYPPPGYPPGDRIVARRLERPPRHGWLYWFVPALTFVIGLGLGVLLMGLSGSRVIGGAPTPTPTPHGTTSPQSGSVRVPAVCVQAAQDGAKATALFNQARDALSHFDLTRMRQVFDEATRLERTVQREVQQCQAQQ